MPSAPAEALGGAALLGRGASFLLRRPRLFWLGALPPLVTSVVFVVALVLLVAELPALTGWLTPFAQGWSEGMALTARIVVGTLLVGGVVLLMVLVFSTLTLAIGSPVYDKISEAVDRAHPRAPEPLDEPLRTGVARAVRQSVALVLVSAAGALVLFGVGFVPVAGQVVAAVGGALFGGWMLAIELVGSPLERRGVLTLAERRRTLRRRRWRSLGLGVPSFLLLSIPFVAVVVFPVATAAGTLLARQLRSEATDLPERSSESRLRQVTDQ
ncbi:EI24 domain-containing protein [Microlunatus flavus]|uniref:CysZ protein n=1 Tax=Microlunatus flavus TaxID=1036181 RepID=A0A1H9CFA8_9ACTN|nr:EI24 domain-containing protein [Microlunatus flavus]SEP99697.1 CysZ protein [Microlunatus flavus]